MTTENDMPGASGDINETNASAVVRVSADAAGDTRTREKKTRRPKADGKGKAARGKAAAKMARAPKEKVTAKPKKAANTIQRKKSAKAPRILKGRVLSKSKRAARSVRKAHGVGLSGEAAPVAQGGVAGLRRFGRAKLARQQKSVTETLKAIRQVLSSSLEAAGRKRLEKGKLAGDIVPLAKLAHKELTELLCDVDPKPLVGGALEHFIPANEGWSKVLRAIARLANEAIWPEASELKAWIVHPVLPLLGFALDGTEHGVGHDELVVANSRAAVKEFGLPSYAYAPERTEDESLEADVASVVAADEDAADADPAPGLPEASPVASPTTSPGVRFRPFRANRSGPMVPGLPDTDPRMPGAASGDASATR